jgi:UDP-N-acetylmuramate--alanine ligase
VLVLFQPHGYGPLAKMKQELIDCFADNLAPEDVLLLCQPAYFGGTVERTVGSEDIVAGVIEAGRIAEYVAERADAGSRLAELAREGDRIVIMGARDDTLSVFAAEVLAKL